MNGNVTGSWTGGANNMTPFIAPDYTDVPDNWTYTNTTLLGGDDAGGALGSMLEVGVEPDVPPPR